ncbi:MAG: hypothetical protein [Circular genetic element sp.]|nr:MAG: hypothetical protein [Circular genetic element sp.]
MPSRCLRLLRKRSFQLLFLNYLFILPVFICLASFIFMSTVFVLGIENMSMSCSTPTAKHFTVSTAIVTIAPNTLYSLILITDRVEPFPVVYVSHIYSS